MEATKHKILWPELIWVVSEYVYFSDSCMGMFTVQWAGFAPFFEDLCVPGTLSALEIMLGGGSGKLEMEDGWIQT